MNQRKSNNRKQKIGSTVKDRINNLVDSLLTYEDNIHKIKTSNQFKTLSIRKNKFIKKKSKPNCEIVLLSKSLCLILDDKDNSNNTIVSKIDHKLIELPKHSYMQYNASRIEK